ncbi:MAG: hypothetical protein JSU70_02705 [Phycisphaerales bacterium]|nr:MAG: hypothetical protein JSU70_02705 [Phycisphaerales bacterium]
MATAWSWGFRLVVGSVETQPINFGGIWIQQPEDPSRSDRPPRDVTPDLPTVGKSLSLEPRIEYLDRFPGRYDTRNRKQLNAAEQQ